MSLQPVAVQLIIEEHQAIVAVLRALQRAVEGARAAPDFGQLRAMLVYLDEVPAHVHHANENLLLFPLIRERCPALRPVLDRLEAEHGRVEQAMRELGHALNAWQVMGDMRREAFELLARTYTDSYLGHMAVEEDYILPVAMDYLGDADWHALAAAFERQRGVLSGAVSRSHRELYERIVAEQPLH
jgi:hemerythrin-like domain-containing protein